MGAIMTAQGPYFAPFTTTRHSPGVIDSPRVRAGKAWAERTLLELTRGGKAHMWWWEASERGLGSVLCLQGNGNDGPARQEFTDSLLRDCAQDESARGEMRARLDAVVAEVTKVHRA